MSNGTTVSVNIDFSNVWNRKCAVSEDTSKTDFEVWTPFNQTCTFGANVEYLRRKPSRDCFIGDSYLDLSPKINTCTCSLSDYDCDQYHSWENEACVRIPNINIPEPSCINGIKRPLSGYVKKKISQCSGGQNLEADLVPCGGVVDSISWPLLYFVLLPITCFSVYVFYLYINGGLGRNGAIYLPLDADLRVGPRSQVERVWNVVSGAASNARDAFVRAWIQLRDYFSNRARNAEGYHPVSNYYDPALASNSLELDWNDDNL